MRAQDLPAAERLFKVAMAEVRAAGGGTASAAVAAAAAAYDGPPARDAGAASASGGTPARPPRRQEATASPPPSPTMPASAPRAPARETDQACRVAGLELALVQGHSAVQREAEQLTSLGDALAPQLRAVASLLRAEATMAAKAHDRAVGAALSALQQARAAPAAGRRQQQPQAVVPQRPGGTGAGGRAPRTTPAT
ncbi:MAG: hypothetical protein U1F49_20665 [Rubrivivax sp.]